MQKFSLGGHMKRSTLQIILLSMFFTQSMHTMQTISFAQQASTLDSRLPNLHTALNKQGKDTASLIEYLDHLVQRHHSPDTWHLQDGARNFTRDLLQMLDTIAAEQHNQVSSTILLQGNPGSLPISLLAATLFWIGKNDVSIQVISENPIPSQRQLHRIIRTFLGTNDRCFIQQFKTIDDFTKASRKYLRQPNTLISFTGQPELLEKMLHNPLVFDYAGRTVR